MPEIPVNFRRFSLSEKGKRCVEGLSSGAKKTSFFQRNIYIMRKNRARFPEKYSLILRDPRRKMPRFRIGHFFFATSVTFVTALRQNGL